MESVVELGKKGATHRFTTAHYLKKKKASRLFKLKQEGPSMGSCLSLYRATFENNL